MQRDRRQAALEVRQEAAQLAADRQHPTHRANAEERRFRFACDPSKPSYLANFTKGLAHDHATGLIVEPDDYQAFVRGIDSGDPRDFVDTPLGPRTTWRTNPDLKVRAWESQGAGLTFDLEGPDAQAVTMPPAPEIGSDELTAEIGEVYAQALLRDVPFTDITSGKGASPCGDCVSVADVLKALNKLRWFGSQDCCELSDEECSRMRGTVIPQTPFRGITRGDDIGPYISQFMLCGNEGLQGLHNRADGYIAYGAITVDQRVRIATPCRDYMQTWDEWLDVQDGADLRGTETYEKDPGTRFITTPRDLATYVHFDALYEAYLNACLILLAEGVKFDPGIPFQLSDSVDHQQGFAQFGGPHILSLVTEVANRALKAVRYQKFNIHRRLRPEALAARIANHGALGEPLVDEMVDDLKHILKLVAANNPHEPKLGKANHLLPMAFPEGSPMHPSYGAGHATVAGACVTILKALFDTDTPLTLAGPDTTAFVPTNDGLALTQVPVTNGRLTVEGELNKLASNIAIGRATGLACITSPTTSSRCEWASRLGSAFWKSRSSPMERTSP